MPKYIYKAKKGPEKTIEGELIAESEAVALSKIEKMGCTPVWVREKDSESGSTGGGTVRGRVNVRDINIFTRQLAGLIKGGVPILRALRIVEDQCQDRRLRRIIGKIQDDVRDGKMLSDAIQKYPSVFPTLFVNMVKSGESGGILDVILFRLADARDREEEVRKKIQSALAYPMLVLSVGVVTVFVMVTFFLPRISSLFRQFKDLPLPTRILIEISDFTRDYWFWAIFPVLLLIAIGRKIVAGGKGKLLVDSIKLRLPVMGRLVMQGEVSRFARTMSLLIEAGIPIERCLRLSSDTLRNEVLRLEIEQVRHGAVEQGMSVASGLESAKRFPAYARNMIAVGEEGGHIEQSLSDVASFYEGEVERQVGVMTSLIEPVLILVVGGIVGFIAIAMMLPIFAVTRSVVQ